MECCVGSLKDVFVDKSQYKIDNPANGKTFGEREKAIRNMAEYAVQLCNGISFLHSKKMVHRDLKLENVLVSIYYQMLHACDRWCSGLLTFAYKSRNKSFTS